MQNVECRMMNEKTKNKKNKKEERSMELVNSCHGRLRE
jgi:hypothetical protein